MAAAAPTERAARALARGDAAYPARLLDLASPPATLHVRGTLERTGRAIAIVGARAATAYGRRVAHGLAGDLARLGWCVVSGLAHGIDAAAHEGALAADGASVAVLPGPLECIVPRGHEALADAIASRGALVTERGPGAPIRPRSFLDRNRLIAAWAAAVVVVEAAERSGSLSTAAHARTLGRPVLAVPGDVDRPTSRGTNALLRDGALPCLDAGDAVRAAGGGAPNGEPTLAGALEATPRSVEWLAGRAGVAVDEALAALTALEWAGLAIAHPGPRWSRRPE